VRLGLRTLVPLALCGAAAAAALAHFAIDIVGDYALPHDTYDNLQHGSRELLSGLALVLAVALAARGLRICCEIAAINRTRILRPPLRMWEVFGFLFGTVAVSAILVPAMECLDGGLAGVPVRELDDAFGGSILLGLGTTAVCAGAVALLVYAVARWLICHHDSIATIIETLLRPTACTVRPSGYDLTRHLCSPRRRRAIHALRLSKRGPPEAIFV